MKQKTNLSLIAFLLLIASLSCEGNQSDNMERIIEIDTVITTEVGGFDSIKAAEYGADEYGMKSYVMAFLKAGPNRDLDSAEVMNLQMAHMENIDRMAENGDLVLAGPFLDGGELRGIYIFNVETVEEAEALTNTDPAIQAGSLVMELKPWYGSAALIPVNDIHKTLSEKGITEK